MRQRTSVLEQRDKAKKKILQWSASLEMRRHLPTVSGKHEPSNFPQGDYASQRASSGGRGQSIQPTRTGLRVWRGLRVAERTP